MRAQREMLNRARLLLGNFRRTNMLCSAARARIQERILVCEIVDAAFRDDFQNGQRLVAQDADGQFAARNKFLDEHFLIVFRDIGHRGVHLAFVLDDIDADGRTLARRLDHERNWNRRALAQRDDLPIRRRYAFAPKRVFRTNLVEGQLAFRDAFARVGDAALFEDSLHLAVFAKRSVNGEEGEFDVRGQFEVRTFYIDFENVDA